VAFVEDHSYPAPGWAEALIKAHSMRNVAVVGPVVLNANPSSAVSWGCFLIFYGYWIKSFTRQKVTHLPGNQSCYNREILLEYGERLSEMLEAESVLHWDLQSKGYLLHLEKEAVIYHLNFSLMVPSIIEYYFASRVFASNRARNWMGARKTIYALGSPLLPAIRLSRMLEDVCRGELEPSLFWKALVLMIIILVAGTMGEMLGYAFGPGDAKEKLIDFEKTHHTYITDDDLNEVENLTESNKR
jgi:hypothetical protein